MDVILHSIVNNQQQKPTSRFYMTRHAGICVEFEHIVSHCKFVATFLATLNIMTVAKKLPRVVGLITQAEAAARIHLNSS